MPFKTGLVFTYDCGEFEKNLTDGLEMIDYSGFEAGGQSRKPTGSFAASVSPTRSNAPVALPWKRPRYA